MFATAIDPFLVQLERHQVWIRKVAIVVRLLFGAHHHRLATFKIPKPGLLIDCATLAQHLRLALDLVFDGILDELERIDVLEFNLGPKLLLAQRTEREIRLTAEAPFIHIAVTDLEIHEHITETLQIGHDFLGRPQVRLSHDFQQRGSRPI